MWTWTLSMSLKYVMLIKPSNVEDLALHFWYHGWWLSHSFLLIKTWLWGKTNPMLNTFFFFFDFTVKNSVCPTGELIKWKQVYCKFLCKEIDVRFQCPHSKAALFSMCHNSTLCNRICFTGSDWDPWLFFCYIINLDILLVGKYCIMTLCLRKAFFKKWECK